MESIYSAIALINEAIAGVKGDAPISEDTLAEIAAATSAPVYFWNATIVGDGTLTVPGDGTPTAPDFTDIVPDALEGMDFAEINEGGVIQLTQKGTYALFAEMNGTNGEVTGKRELILASGTCVPVAVINEAPADEARPIGINTVAVVSEDWSGIPAPLNFTVAQTTAAPDPSSLAVYIAKLR